ncbi:MAG: sigma-54-dependent Fis family transcriptional regulator [Ktedonobacterales bacterium]|nr:sigma-54-dependent Fis family transcriptional regulator [Ktedonobacterales bacterium]
MSPTNESLPQELPTNLPEAPLWIGQTPAMQQVARYILAVAASATTGALILGEHGTGKELVARAIHQQSRQANETFLPINCGGLPAQLIEAELFGSEPGGFTNARSRRGYVEQANNGTLFLDEIGELPLAVQPTLLRFLQTHHYRRLGGEREQPADVRVLAATLRDLQGAIAAGTFRPDLFYRLNVVVITLPPLRARQADLPALVRAALRERAAVLGLARLPVCDEAVLALFTRYTWPGNMRELRNVLEHAIILSNGGTITPAHLPPRLLAAPASSMADELVGQISALELPATGVELPALVHLLEDRLIAQAMTRTRANQSSTARLLGLTRDQLRQRLKRQGDAP